MLYPSDLDGITESLWDESFETYCLKKYAKVVSQADQITDAQIMAAANEVKAEAKRRKKKLSRDILIALTGLFLLSKRRDQSLFRTAVAAGTITKKGESYYQLLNKGDDLIPVMTGDKITSNFGNATHKELKEIIKPAFKSAETASQGIFEHLGYSSNLVPGKPEIKPIYKAYADAVNLARQQVVAGEIAYQSAIETAINQCADGGLTAIKYDSGINYHIDTAVRRAVMTGINQMSQDANDRTIRELGAEYVEVSAHAGARPSHAEWQGGVYKINGSAPGYPNLYDVTGLGTAGGLLGVNCRHSYYAFFPGVSEPSYSSKELEEIDPPPVKYQGKTYTYYEVTQKQRAYERAIRKTKRRILMKKEAGIDTAKDDALLGRQRANYQKFSKACGQWVHKERM